MGRCSTRTSHFKESFFRASGSAKPAGKYSTGAALILGSTTLSHSLMERVKVSHAEEMYSRIGFKPSACAASAALFGPQRAGEDRIEQRPKVRPSPRRASLK